MGDRVIYSTGTGILMVTKPINGARASVGNGITIGLTAPNSAAVDEFHAEGSRLADATRERPARGRPSRTPTPPTCVTRRETSLSHGA